MVIERTTAEERFIIEDAMNDIMSDLNHSFGLATAAR